MCQGFGPGFHSAVTLGFVQGFECEDEGVALLAPRTQLYPWVILSMRHARQQGGRCAGLCACLLGSGEAGQPMSMEEVATALGRSGRTGL